ncbi:hypothetical protein LINPERPRIM_LOCUS14119 [Linum perenne]
MKRRRATATTGHNFRRAIYLQRQGKAYGTTAPPAVGSTGSGVKARWPADPVSLVRLFR